MTTHNEQQEVIRTVHEDNVSSSKLLGLAITSIGVLVLGIGGWLITNQEDLSNQFIRNNAALIRVESEIVSLKNLMEQNQRLTKLETAAELNTITSSLATMQAETKQLVINDVQQWPRLRAHGENIQVLKNEIEKVCKCNIRLKEPEKF